MHFREMSEELKIPIVTDFKLMTFADVLKLDLFKNQEYIQEVAEKAKVQENLEKEISKIENTWKEY